MAEASVGSGEGNSNSESPSLFEGKHFWLSMNIPQRSRFKELITQHGGVVRLLEKDADIKLVDHKKKNLPPDAFSYQYVEESIRTGRLADLESHRAGPSAARPVGATYIPSRGTKVVYTLQDDQFLWDWMQQYEGKPGYAISGNKIYQDLAANNPRHTFQSYRDRYLKRLRGRPRPGGMVGSTSRPPIAQDTDDKTPAPAPAPSSTMEERPPQKLDVSTSRQDDRKRKRSSDVEPVNHQVSKDTEVSNQKRRAINRTPEPTSPIPPHTQTECASSNQQSPELTGRLESIMQETRTPETHHQTETAHHKEQTQLADPENEVDDLFLELPFFPSSPEPEVEGSGPDIDEWIDDRLQTGKAQNEAQVIEALRCTSMDPHLADEVLSHLVKRKSIPNDMPGVWTPEDDRCLEGYNARDIERLLKKHGTDPFNARWDYLGMVRTAGHENTGNQ